MSAVQSVLDRYFAGPQPPLPPDIPKHELKYCETCGRPFARLFAPTFEVEQLEFDGVYTSHYDSGTISKRRRDHGQRYCKKCLFNPVPNLKAQEDYRSQFPGTESQMDHRSIHLPRYDDSLAAIQGKKKS